MDCYIRPILGHLHHHLLVRAGFPPKKHSSVVEYDMSRTGARCEGSSMWITIPPRPCKETVIQNRCDGLVRPFLQFPLNRSPPMGLSLANGNKHQPTHSTEKNATNPTNPREVANRNPARWPTYQHKPTLHQNSITLASGNPQPHLHAGRSSPSSSSHLRRSRDHSTRARARKHPNTI